MSGRRGKPLRRITEIAKFGNWGNIRYKHLLECGHSEVLARASRAKELACSTCGEPPRDGEKEKPSGFDHLLPPTILDFSDQVSQDEVEVKKLQAHVASLLGIHPESISIISSDAGGRLVVKSAYIFLSASDLRSMIDRLDNND
jgi:hypothetical protein